MGLPASVDPHDAVSLAKYYETHAIPVQYNAGFIVLSVVVSLIGCYTTLLLIGRRTGNHGWRNLMFLVLAATTTSSVGIWGMHFIGMHLQLKPSEFVTWYVHFAPGFTVFSLFLPLVILCFAFYFLGGQGQVDYLRVSICGVIFGGIVSLMHYSASFKASFKASYEIVNLVFSIVIACTASTAALLAFFRFRERWQDVWWKRLLCGLILATAVCAMHYVALVGTSWKVRPGHYSQGWTDDHNSTLAYAIAGMCIALCLLSAILAAYDAILRKSGRLSGQQLVVASASFTRDGKILVKPDGSLPMQVMNTNISMCKIMQELDLRSETFSWLYSLTWDWSVLEPFLPRIMARMLGLQALSDVDDAGVESVKEAFVLASQGLASELYLPVNNLGVLFDKVVTTSMTTATSKDPKKQTKRDDRSSNTSIIENGFIRTPVGVMLVLVRELPSEGPDSSARYISKGFRLSEPRFLAPLLCDRLGVDKDLMVETLEQLRSYARRGIRSVVQPQGVYASLFAVRPSSVKEGTDEILVYNFARHQVPAFRLPEIAQMTDEMRDWLKSCRSANIDSVIAHARSASHSPRTGSHPSEELRNFQKSLVAACEAILDATQIWPGMGSLTKINTEVVDVPSSSDDLGCAHMIVFNVLLPEPLMPHERNMAEKILHLPQVHSTAVSIADGINDKERPFVFTPLSFFQTAQAMLFQGPRSQVFSQHARTQLLAWYPSALAAPLPPTQEKFDMEEKALSPLSSRPSFSNPFSTPGSTFNASPQTEHHLSYDAPERTQRLNSSSSAETEESQEKLAELPDAVVPPRPAKSPRRSSKARPAPPKVDGEPEDLLPAVPAHLTHQQQNPDHYAGQSPQAPVLQAPAPVYGRPQASELSNLWGPTLLTPREQARIANLHQSALARQTNDDWVARTTAELRPQRGW